MGGANARYANWRDGSEGTMTGAAAATMVISDTATIPTRVVPAINQVPRRAGRRPRAPGRRSEFLTRARTNPLRHTRRRGTSPALAGPDTSNLQVRART